MMLAISLLVALGSLTGLNEAHWPEMLHHFQGKILVVNFWATWCAPCREEFPALVRFYKRHRAEGVQVVAVSMDDEGDEARAEDFLRAQGATFPSYIVKTQNLRSLLSAVDESWQGGLPATFIFDRQGKKIVSHIGETTLDELEKALKRLQSRAPDSR